MTAEDHGHVHLDLQTRIQISLDVPGDSVNEPDAALVTMQQLASMPYPQCAELVMKVADSSLDFDYEKAFEYAAASVPEYWILGVIARQSEVYLDPRADATAVFGYRYTSRKFFRVDDSVFSLLRPDVFVPAKTVLGSH